LKKTFKVKVAILICLICFVFSCAAVMAVEDNVSQDKDKVEKYKEIRELMALTNVQQLCQNMLDRMIGSFKDAFPEVPASYWDKLKGKFKVEKIIDMIIPVYDKYFTQDDIRQLIKFYQTPVGKKIIKVMPSISAETMTLGQKWGAKISEEMMNEVKQEVEKSADKKNDNTGKDNKNKN